MTVEKETTLAVGIPEDPAAGLERLAEETGRGKSDYARQAIIEFLEDQNDYRRAVATREKNEPRLSLEEAKRAFGLED